MVMVQQHLCHVLVPSVVSVPPVPKLSLPQEATAALVSHCGMGLWETGLGPVAFIPSVWDNAI
jgi:hypothetical protein